ncbi:hypothetical protein BDF20DRAFT_893368 [Mycotypha africana]|uniref:uncharacterized protein n=1 Tax=Mycotypha africana TaxID=64632 RepID=UPI002301317D|nr:uncharacterized protein BDF20DRAFT_893368 [Mycotypha africana]KAI8969130.1 hypothetical protein BDF20DRAFT_893368 [Mycotypha africana]
MSHSTSTANSNNKLSSSWDNKQHSELSFFNRVFGHHSSSESSRAGSPIPSSSSSSHLTITTNTSPTTSAHNNKRKHSRHNRNSSTGQLSTYLSHKNNSATTVVTAPISVLSTQHMRQHQHQQHRRRSFDNTKHTNIIPDTSNMKDVIAPSTANYNNKELSPIPYSSTSAKISSKHQHYQQPLPFPRGGRQVGGGDTLRRSNSIERQYFKPTTNEQPQQQPRKRHLFRFGKKKSHGLTNHANQYHDSSNTLIPRKVSNDNASLLNDLSSASDVQRYYYQHQQTKEDHNHNNKKKGSSFSSSSSSAATTMSNSHNNSSSNINSNGGSGNSKKNHHFHYGHLHYPHPHILHHHHHQGSSSSSNSNNKNDKDSLLQLKLDQNFEKMDGIVNKEYYHELSTAPTATVSPIPSVLQQQEAPKNSNYDVLEAWAPPDSWGVQLPSTTTAVNLLDEDTQQQQQQPSGEFVDYHMDVQNEAPPIKYANIKVYRPDETYNTLHVPLDTTVMEILHKIANKYFMSLDINKVNLVMRRHNKERVLHLPERPLQLQKLLQEQMGYMESDKIDDCTYLVRFQLMPNNMATTTPSHQLSLQNEKDMVGQHIDLQSRCLNTIPIFLYHHAHRIVSLDISKNLQIIIPQDFAQQCSSAHFKQLCIADNEYVQLPSSLKHMISLEHLNISGNKLKELDHADLHVLSQLRTLRAINNKLEALPASFATCFKRLTSLYISNNAFTKFPLVVCSINSLTYLDVSFNKIQVFPDEISQLTNLVGLYAIANRLTGALPLSFTYLTKLRELDLRQNLISDLEVVSHLPSLEVLLMDYNPTSIVHFRLRNLRQLKMYKNHLTQFNLSLPSANALSALTELNLSCCKLSSLSEDLFHNVLNLERLILDSNTLNRLPSSIGALRKLVRLSIQNNNLETLPDEVGQLAELRTLDAQKNNLKVLPQEIWLCASLQTLNCSSNLLESFPEPICMTAVAVAAAAAAAAAAASSASSSFSHTNSLYVNTNATESPAISDTTSSMKASSRKASLTTVTINNSSTATAATTASQQQQQQQMDYFSSDVHSLATPILNNNNSPSYPHLVSSSYSSDQVMVHPHQQLPSQPQSTPLLQPPSQQTQLQQPNFNPPSFFASPRNHPPPLSLSLRQLFLGDNRLTDDVWSPLSLFLELRTLNLSFNDLYEIPPDGLCHQHLYELYLSGNHLTSLPADDIERLQYLRVLAVNGNKLQTLPAEIGKLRKLLVLDVGNNVLKYNIANWPYDWNWNWNLGLKYLNLSGNKRLEIQKSTAQLVPSTGGVSNEHDMHVEANLNGTSSVGAHGDYYHQHHYHHPYAINKKQQQQQQQRKDLSDFSALTRLRMLGLMDITILGVSIPEEFHDRRVRTSPSEVNRMSYGVADWLGPSDHLSTWDLVMPRFRGKDNECLFALFDGCHGGSTNTTTNSTTTNANKYHHQNYKGGTAASTASTAAIPTTHINTTSAANTNSNTSLNSSKLTKELNDMFTLQFTKELASLKSDDTIVSAVRRAFLSMEQHLGQQQQQLQLQSQHNYQHTNTNSSLPYQHPSSSPNVAGNSGGASAVVCYIAGTKLYVANVGDALAVISRNNGQAFEITQKHIPLNPSEVSRIRAAGGYVSNSGLLNNELNVSRNFGHFHLIPAVNCNPFVSTIDLAENDEFVIIASRGLWDRMTYQTAVDIARTEKDDLMAAAQKLRDFAITYGANDNLMVMVIGVGDLFMNKRGNKRYNKYNNRSNAGAGRVIGGGSNGSGSGVDILDDGMMVKSSNKRNRGKEEIPVDSTLARLEREVAPPIDELALVFTDIKSSTQFWETQPENMRAAIKIHDAIMRRTLRSVGGYEVKTEGDAFMVCFKNITAALLWCFTVQLQLLEADWPAGILDTEEGREIEKDGVIVYRGLSVRMGIHFGSPVFERNPITKRMDYFGPVVNKASRICNAADGGQICVSMDVITALRNFPSMFEQQQEAMLGNQSRHNSSSSNGLEPTTTMISIAANDDFLDSFPINRDLIQLKQLGFHVVELGERRLKGLETPETLSLVYPKQLLSRIEVDKSQAITATANTAANNGNNVTMSAIATATTTGASSVVSAKELGTSSLGVSPSVSNTNSIGPASLLTSPELNASQASTDYLSPRPFINGNSSNRKAIRTIDPNLVCAMSNLAIRLERLTSGNVQLTRHQAGSTINNQYTLQQQQNSSSTSLLDTTTSNNNSMIPYTKSTAFNGLGLMLDRHLREDATDEELIMMMENCVTRVENAVSSLYLSKMGRFANVLEKLAEATNLDDSHILKALQMYAEIQKQQEQDEQVKL